MSLTHLREGSRLAPCAETKLARLPPSMIGATTALRAALGLALHGWLQPDPKGSDHFEAAGEREGQLLSVLIPDHRQTIEQVPDRSRQVGPQVAGADRCREHVGETDRRASSVDNGASARALLVPDD